MRLIDAEALDKARIDYIVSGYANDPEDCSEFGNMIIKAPTVCDIEQIRAEIEKERQACIDAHDQYGAVAIGEVLKIFDKYKGGQDEVD